jgi:hypothetical protein
MFWTILRAPPQYIYLETLGTPFMNDLKTRTAAAAGASPASDERTHDSGVRGNPKTVIAYHWSRAEQKLLASTSI